MVNESAPELHDMNNTYHINATRPVPVTSHHLVASTSLLLFSLSTVLLYVPVLRALMRLGATTPGYLFLVSMGYGDVSVVLFTLMVSLMIFFDTEIVPHSLLISHSIVFNIGYIVTSYHYTLVAISRMLCVVRPALFYTLRRRTVRNTCCVVWALALGHNALLHCLMDNGAFFYVSPSSWGFVPMNITRFISDGWQHYWVVHEIVSSVVPMLFYAVAIIRVGFRKLRTTTRLRRRVGSGALQVRLLVCCLINSTAFLIYSMMLSHIIVIDVGRWNGWLWQIIGVINSAVNPILFITISQTIRAEALPEVCLRTVDLSMAEPSSSSSKKHAYENRSRACYKELRIISLHGPHLQTTRF